MYPGLHDPGAGGPGPYGNAQQHPQQHYPSAAPGQAQGAPGLYSQPPYGAPPGAPPNAYSQLYGAHPASGFDAQQQQHQQQQQGFMGGPQPFMPGIQMQYPQQQQQHQYGGQQQQQYGGYGAGPSIPPLGADPGISIPGVSPMAFMAGSSLLSGGQHWGQSLVNKVQQRTGWLTGGLLNFYFNINRAYVLSKLLMLVAPFLRRWTYTRQPEQIQGGQKYRPPIVDVNAPDLYIPLVGLWTYTMLVAVVCASKGKFKPDFMYSTLWSASVAWCMHTVVARVVLRALTLPAAVPWVELFAYTGYAFVPACLSILVGVATGRWGYWIAYGYGALCMSIFMVRTMKRIIFQEAGHYGRDMTLTNYLLLSLALFQFPYIFWLGLRP